ncbi:hypothetical protein Gohar_018747 [Gossypium harknessii]|uniref:RNase H type-1 domain-containing protein n=1 Tax=Gossypium harknessii TaxID=34285 RepID=A0A7J9GAS3_9ROSI|nr:hypothetical protein [Gossypium harknessii]
MKIYMQELESLEIVLPQCQKAHNIIWELPIRDTMKVHFDATFHQLAKKATLVVKKLKAFEKDKSTVSVLIKEIKVKANSFESVEFRFIHCQGNRTTHLLTEFLILDRGS